MLNSFICCPKYVDLTGDFQMLTACSPATSASVLTPNVYLVENVREDGRTKQRIIANLGRKEVVVARGDLDRLARSVARPAQRSMVLSVVAGEAPPNAVCRRIGPTLLFERLWQEAGCRAVLGSVEMAPSS